MEWGGKKIGGWVVNLLRGYDLEIRGYPLSFHLSLQKTPSAATTQAACSKEEIEPCNVPFVQVQHHGLPSPMAYLIPGTVSELFCNRVQGLAVYMFHCSKQFWSAGRKNTLCCLFLSCFRSKCYVAVLQGGECCRTWGVICMLS